MLLPTARRMLENRPYIMYLYMKIPLTLFSLLPSNIVTLYVKSAMVLEDWNLTLYITLIIALLGGVAGIYPLVGTRARALTLLD